MTDAVDTPNDWPYLVGMGATVTTTSCLTAEDRKALTQVVLLEILAAEAVGQVTGQRVRRRLASLRAGLPPLPMYEMQRADGEWRLTPKYVRDPGEAVRLHYFLLERGCEVVHTGYDPAIGLPQRCTIAPPYMAQGYVSGAGTTLEEALVRAVLNLTPEQLESLRR